MMNFNPSISPDLITVIVSVSVIVSLYFIWTSINLGSSLAKLFVSLLRILSLAVLAILLLNPVRLEKVEMLSLPKSKSFLIDHSKSMQMGTDQTRLEEAQQILRKAKTDKTTSFYFAEKLSPNTENLGSNSKSNMGQALYSTLQKQESGKSLGELFLFTDGRLHDRQKLSEAIQFALDKGIRIHTFLPQEEAKMRNISLSQCLYPRRVLPKQDISVTLKTDTKAFVDQEVTIRIINSDTDELRASKVVKLNESEQEFNFTFKAKAISEKFTALVDWLPQELSHLDNSYNFEVKVEADEIKVLYMEGSNSQHPLAGQSRKVPAPVFMEQAWQETANIKFETLLVSKQLTVGGTLFRKNDASLSYPTTREELFQYDVVICSDINRFILSKAQLAWTRELVEKRGAGFCMIGGNTSFGDGGWDKTTWEQMIPIDMSEFGYGNREIDFQLSFVPKYFTHPILQIDPDPKVNEEILKKSFKLTGCNLIDRLKPGAISLANHEFYDDMSVLAVQNYGKGRSMAFTSDSAGGWGHFFQGYWGPEEKNNNYYKKFWVNAVKWLSENSLNRKKTDLLIRTDSVRYEPGEQVKLWVSLNSIDLAKMEQLKLKASFEADSDESVTLIYDKKTGFFTGEIFAPEEGGLKALTVKAFDRSGSQLASSNVNLDLRKVDLEVTDLTVDEKLLTDLSKLTGGESFKSLKEFEAIYLSQDENFEGKNHQVQIPQWDQWWVLLLVLFLLSAEWLFRKIHLGALS